MSLKTHLLTFLAIGIFPRLAFGEGNLNLWGSANRINWGDHSPVDVLEELRKKCEGQSCTGTSVEVDTQVVIDERIGRKKIIATVHDASFDTVKADGPHMVAGLKALISVEPWLTSSKQHWEAGSDGKSCQGAQDNFCWIPNDINGDAVQFEAPNALSGRFFVIPDTVDSFINLRIEVVDIESTAWDCAKVVESTEKVAGLVSKIPDVAFTLLNLFCDLKGI